MTAKLLALAPILAGIGLIFAEQIKAEISERLTDWRMRQRRKRLDRNRATEKSE